MEHFASILLQQQLHDPTAIFKQSTLPPVCIAIPKPSGFRAVPFRICYSWGAAAVSFRYHKSRMRSYALARCRYCLGCDNVGCHLVQLGLQQTRATQRSNLRPSARFLESLRCHFPTKSQYYFSLRADFFNHGSESLVGSVPTENGLRPILPCWILVRISCAVFPVVSDFVPNAACCSNLHKGI